MHLLIPYVQLRHHLDPLFEEFTYGDERSRGRKLKHDLIKGDYVFFHTSKGEKKYITAYYVVDSVLPTADVLNDQALKAKYRNPHLERYTAKKGNVSIDDVILFGDPIRSRVLKTPLHFSREIALKLSLKINFPEDHTDTQIIGSATRSWRALTNRDVEILLSEIQENEKDRNRATLLTSEEVSQTIETDVEQYLVSNPGIIGKGLKVVERQLPIKTGRIDLLFEGDDGNLVIVEIKFGRLGRDALQQIKNYMHEMKNIEHSKKVSGVLVCSGVMPAFEEDFRKQNDVRILKYGWEMKTTEEW
jgi:Holliday junction resolvase-like predicted endonuclease